MQTAVYYFPNYHVDPRNEAVHGKGWTEWELMKCARPRFEGHKQPKIPMWGYEDEADPAAMAKKIDAAADHGVDAFIFDWYWYEGPYIERALKEGFLGAPNRDRLKFALMWANHDWRNIHPGSRQTKTYPLNFPWSTTRHTVGAVWDYIIENFMTRPEYWRVDGMPYFSIFAVHRFIDQMGGAEAAADVFALFREKALAAGLPGVHISGIMFDILLASDSCKTIYPQEDWVNKIGFTSYTSYNNLCIGRQWHTEFPRVDYNKATDDYMELLERIKGTLPAKYLPVVTTGWDSSPRCVQSETFEKSDYPWLAVMEPDKEKFGRSIRKMAEYLRKRPENEQILLVNAWNEWTEGSYLEPDNYNGMDLLIALKENLNA